MRDLPRKLLITLAVGFALFYLVTKPAEAAEAVRGFFGAFGSVFEFFTTLAN